MNEILLAFFLGILHGLELDHLMAISALINKEQDKKSSLKVGFHFGIYHMLTLVIIGIFGLIFNLTIPQWFEQSAEIFGGILLIVIGLWTLSYYLQIKTHSHKHIHNAVEHNHAHFHLFNAKHIHKHSKIFGSLFALSGLSSLLLIVPVAFASSIYGGIINILLFGTGVIMSMLVFSIILTAFYNIIRKIGNVYRITTIVKGSLSLVTGVFWIILQI